MELLKIERTFDVPAATVWKALTDKDEMKQWYFDLAEFKPEAGFEYEFTAGDERKQYMHLCKVIEIVENKKLKFSWRYDGYEGDSFVTIELFDEDNKTKLKLTHEGIETFPASNPDFARENFALGWNHLIGISLNEFIESKSLLMDKIK